MFKRWMLTDVLMFAIALSFAAQIYIFNATTKQNVVGIVYGANGPLKGVYVSAEGDNGSGSAITDSSGHYTMTTGLKTGTYNVTTEFTTGYINGEVDSVSVTAGQTTPNVNFDLQLSGGISGTVTDAVSGKPVNGTLVSSILANGTRTYGSYAITDSNGMYSMATNMPTGTYNVTVLYPEGHFNNSTTVTVTSGVETKNVNFALAKSGIISGRITAPDGTPVNATVSAISLSTYDFGSAKTDANGNYSIVSGLGTASDYIVSASANLGSGSNSTGYINYISVIAGQETSGVDLELTVTITPPIPSGTITGRVTDQSNGTGIRFAEVTAIGSNGYGSNTTDNNGYYTISSGLGDGNDYNVTATASGYEDASYPNLVTVTVDQTTSGVNLQMSTAPASQYGTITGTVTGAPNAIPEFQYPLMAMLSLTLVAAVAGKLRLKKKRYKNTDNTA